MNIKQHISFLAYMIWMSLLSTVVPAILLYIGFDWILASILIILCHSILIFLIKIKIQDNDVLFLIFIGLPIVGLLFLGMLGVDRELNQLIFSRNRINWNILNIFQFLSRAKLYRIKTNDEALYAPFKIVYYKKDINRDGRQMHQFFVKIYTESEYALLLLINPEIKEDE